MFGCLSPTPITNIEFGSIQRQMNSVVGNSGSSLEVSLKKASKINSSEQIGDHIQSTVNILLTAIESDVDPVVSCASSTVKKKHHVQRLKQYSRTVLNRKGSSPINGLAYDLVESVKTTMSWIADKEIRRGVKSVDVNQVNY